MFAGLRKVRWILLKFYWDVLKQYLSLKLIFGSFPIKHLGLLWGAKLRSKAIWDVVIMKFEKKLLPWDIHCLSFGGCNLLIKQCRPICPCIYDSLQDASWGC